MRWNWRAEDVKNGRELECSQLDWVVDCLPFWQSASETVAAEQGASRVVWGKKLPGTGRFIRCTYFHSS